MSFISTSHATNLMECYTCCHSRYKHLLSQVTSCRRIVLLLQVLSTCYFLNLKYELGSSLYGHLMQNEHSGVSEKHTNYIFNMKRTAVVMDEHMVKLLL